MSSPRFDTSGTADTSGIASRSPCSARRLAVAGALLSLVFGAAAAEASSPAELLAGYRAQAAVATSPERGQALFTTRQGRDWSCASCHGAVPTKAGKHASTGKAIDAMAPAFNPERFTDPAKVEKWFRRNCNDVLGRECTPGEKADVLGWLITLKP